MIKTSLPVPAVGTFGPARGRQGSAQLICKFALELFAAGIIGRPSDAVRLGGGAVGGLVVLSENQLEKHLKSFVSVLACSDFAFCVSDYIFILPVTQFTIIFVRLLFVTQKQNSQKR